MGKKKKKKVVPFYRKGWFTLAGVGGVLACLAVIFYFLVLKVPSPETYVERAKTQLKSADFSERKKGAWPLTNFLSTIPSMRRPVRCGQWADQYDRTELEKQMLNRRARFTADGPGETLARGGARQRRPGQARRRRSALAATCEIRRPKEEEDHAWGLVAKKYLTELTAVRQELRKLQNKVAEEKKTGKKYVPDNKAERLALEAVRKEQANQAVNAWNDLKTQVKDDPDNRRWYLLAAQQQRELSELE